MDDWEKHAQLVQDLHRFTMRMIVGASIFAMIGTAAAGIAIWRAW
jgi:hypothetical protein